jgi:hypothetical protein
MAQQNSPQLGGSSQPSDAPELQGGRGDASLIRGTYAYEVRVLGESVAGLKHALWYSLPHWVRRLAGRR